MEATNSPKPAVTFAQRNGSAVRILAERAEATGAEPVETMADAKAYAEQLADFSFAELGPQVAWACQVVEARKDTDPVDLTWPTA